MATKINVRSPFYIKVSQTNIATATLNLYVYTGTFVANGSVANPKYTITKSVVTAGYVVFEIAELIRDYLGIEFNGQYDSQVVWVNAVITTTVSSGSASATVTPDNTNGFVAFDGYGYFDEGVNPRNNETLTIMQSNRTIFRINDFNARIPVYTGNTDYVVYLNKGVVKRTAEITTTTNTSTQIQYVDIFGNTTYDNYKERVLSDNGVFEDNDLLDLFVDRVDIGEVDEVHISDGSTTEVVKIKDFFCSKYEPIKATFVNKYGALQDMYFTLKSIESTQTKSENFKRSIFSESSASYKTYEHQNQSFHTNANDKIILNSDYLNDDNNKIIEEMMISDQVWITKITDTKELVIPVVPATKSVTYKTSVNDKLVQYTIEFNMAFDKINNIR
mgnify:CR=1 FL=1|tara:strand:+ start:2063 stop:3229 length:1167 start_codon:yes stop_codon:yes gene_type:complete